MVQDGRSASEEMKKLGITPAFVEGLPAPVGNWHRLVMRMQEADAPVNYENDPPLEPGDFIEVLPANGQWSESVGRCSNTFQRMTSGELKWIAAARLYW